MIVSQTRIDSICQKLLERPCFFQGLENVFESFFSFLFFGSIHVRDVAKEMKKFATYVLSIPAIIDFPLLYQKYSSNLDVRSAL